MRKLLLVLLLALLAALGPACVPAWADEGGSGNDNAAVAINLEDGASVFEFAFSVRQTMSDVVDHTNTAVAYSECEDCRTVALAVQVVLVASDPSIVTPENVAVAVNYQCTSCETFAAAYQFVLSTGGRVRFTAAGRQELNRIRRELRRLIQQDLPFHELQARIDELMDRLRHVLDNELVPVRAHGHDDRGRGDGSSGGDGSTETTTTETQPPDQDSGTTSTGTTETSTTETSTTETDTTQTTTTTGG